MDKIIHPYIYVGLNSHEATQSAIISSISHVLKIPLKVLVSKDRKRDVVEARQIAMYFLRKNHNLPYTAIGRMFRRDHATVIHACRQVKNLLDYHIEFRKKYFRVASYISNYESTDMDLEVEISPNNRLTWKKK